MQFGHFAEVMAVDGQFHRPGEKVQLAEKNPNKQLPEPIASARVIETQVPAGAKESQKALAIKALPDFRLLVLPKKRPHPLIVIRGRIQMFHQTTVTAAQSFNAHCRNDVGRAVRVVASYPAD